MKNIFFLFLMALSLKGLAQAPVTADPALGQLSITDNVVPGLDRSSTVNPLIPVKLSLPILNLSLFNAIPNGSTTVTIGLGSRMVIDPSYNLATAPLSTYFTWTYNTSASQPRIIGTQIRTIPADFLDSVAVFQVYGTNSLGTSTVSANFSINPSGNVDDADGNNNSTSLQYTVIATTLPVSLTEFNVVKNACNVDVSFNTENEVNLSRFEIEVSKNGSDFVKVGEIAARNASRYNTSFALTDGIKSANLFVRLKSIDKDATYQYSSVKRITGTCDAKRSFVLSAYPNPVRFGRTLSIVSKEGSFDGRYNVSLVDATGRTLQVREMQLNNVSSFKFDIGTLAAGQYLLKVSNDDQSESSIVRFQKN